MKALRRIPVEKVKIDSGFWQNRQRINAEVTLDVVLKRLKETGRIDAMACKWEGGGPGEGVLAWDSDVAKWIEAASYILEQKKDDALIRQIDSIVDDIAANQEGDGYYNPYYQVKDRAERFAHRRGHELYSAGHLMEAAAAYYSATGKDKLLRCMCRYADYIEQVFKFEENASFVTPGHEEIELALVKLYEATGEKRYLELARFFLDQRGCNEKDTCIHPNWSNYYAQDHLPVRAQRTAEGHAVRALYLYSAMADVGRLSGDKELLTACEVLFDNITQKRMYVTGGVGSDWNGETFTADYDLPNETAYAETCAAIALCLFGNRMIQAEPNGKYADAVERAMYNGVLSGISLDGKAFFYENPLSVTPELRRKNKAVLKTMQHYPQAQRQEVFGCFCCPPNITRFLASVGSFIYSCSEDTLFVHHFIGSHADCGAFCVKQETQYPTDGTVKLTVDGDVSTVAVRIPAWCGNSFHIDKAYELRDGYAYIALNGDKTVTVQFEIQPVCVEASPHVRENVGCVAVCRGPVVYCLEAVDNGEHLWNISIDAHTEFQEEFDGELFVPVLYCEGFKRKISEQESLYTPAGDEQDKKAALRLIPYFAFANRGESEMTVWIRRHS